MIVYSDMIVYCASKWKILEQWNLKGMWIIKKVSITLNLRNLVIKTNAASKYQCSIKKESPFKSVLFVLKNYLLINTIKVCWIVKKCHAFLRLKFLFIIAKARKSNEVSKINLLIFLKKAKKWRAKQFIVREDSA